MEQEVFMQIQDLLQRVERPVEIRLSGFSELMLNYLMELADKALEGCPDTRGMHAIVLRTAGDQIHTGVYPVSDFPAEEVIRPLAETRDTQVTHLVVMFPTQNQRRGVDIPSFDLRTRLLALDARNEFALLVVQGHDCLRARTLSSTIPAAT